jgi:hypothetical protein
VHLIREKSCAAGAVNLPELSHAMAGWVRFEGLHCIRLLEQSPMAGNETSQHHLEELRGILAEFYGTADAARHKELDQMLAQFKLYQESWRHC